MTIPTEPIGSIPRPPELIAAMAAHGRGEIGDAALAERFGEALRDTIGRFEATGSPVITDGEQTKPSFATYPIHGSDQFDGEGIVLPFADGHTRQLPRLVSGPFRYTSYADGFLAEARRHTALPVKQAVIAPSAISIFYPQGGVDGYPQEAFIEDLVNEAEADIRRSLDGGAHVVQLDFTEGRLAVKLDPSGQLLRTFVDLNNKVLARFSDAERSRLGVHTCPGGDQDSTHSADVDYAALLPELFRIEVGNYYVQLASEADPERVLGAIRDHLPAGRRVFVGVTDPIDPVVETAEQVCERVLLAARHVPLDQLGTCDDCGFSPFADDQSTSRDVAFAKIKARVDGTRMAAERLGA